MGVRWWNWLQPTLWKCDSERSYAILHNPEWLLRSPCNSAIHIHSERSYYHRTIFLRLYQRFTVTLKSISLSSINISTIYTLFTLTSDRASPDPSANGSTAFSSITRFQRTQNRPISLISHHSIKCFTFYPFLLFHLSSGPDIPSLSLRTSSHMTHIDLHSFPHHPYWFLINFCSYSHCGWVNSDFL